MPPLADATCDIGSNSRAGAGRENRFDGGHVQRFETKLGERRCIEFAFAGRKDDRDSLGLQTARGERQRLGRVAVHPLRVVDQA